MIDQSKTYRTRDGREARVYATDGSGVWPVHGAIRSMAGWTPLSWKADGEWHHSDVDLIESDPHGILPRHRELLASVLVERDFPKAAKDVIDKPVDELGYWWPVALIALARLDGESKGRVSP